MLYTGASKYKKVLENTPVPGSGCVEVTSVLLQGLIPAKSNILRQHTTCSLSRFSHRGSPIETHNDGMTNYM